VPCEPLWRKLERLGAWGFMLTAFQALYADVPMLSKGAPLDAYPFQSRLGLKQGCLLSPLLLGLYVDDFVSCVMANGGQQYHADDEVTSGSAPVLCGRPAPSLTDAGSSLPEGLQSQMNFLAEYSDKNGLTVNLANF